MPDSSATNAIADAYVRLVLAVGGHDEAYVDAYYGPVEWRQQVEAAGKTLAEIRREAEELLLRLAELSQAPALPEASEPRRPRGRSGATPSAAQPQAAALDSAGEAELVALRRRYLEGQLRSLVARVDLLRGRRMTFDEESRALYDAEAPHQDEPYFQEILDRLERELPGKGSLEERLERLRDAVTLPADRLDRAFRAAIDECRERTREHIELPPGETFEVEYVAGRPWSAYNWYRGGFHSLIQVNTELPITIDRILDLACHEGYPGHHVYNLLLEKHLVRDRGWNEYSVYPLFSPQSLIAEGTANFGIEVTFPGGSTGPASERLDFEQSILYPEAGLDAELAPVYREVQELLQALSYAGNEAARRYLDRAISAGEAVAWLERYALMPHERARQRIRFFDTYRSYVINYNLGQDVVRTYIENRGGTADQPERRWQELAKLISSPRLPSGLGSRSGG
jgi:hypothetical protein